MEKKLVKLFEQPNSKLVEQTNLNKKRNEIKYKGNKSLSRGISRLFAQRPRLPKQKPETLKLRL